jgi:hypothetical protein
MVIRLHVCELLDIFCENVGVRVKGKPPKREMQLIFSLPRLATLVVQ